GVSRRASVPRCPHRQEHPRRRGARAGAHRHPDPRPSQELLSGRTMTIVESDTLSARDAVLTAIAGETIVSTLARTAAAHPNAPAYSDRVLSDADREAGRTWRTLTWSEFRLSALVTAAGLVGLGVQPGDR